MAAREIPASLVKGAIVAGKYRVEKILGVGGMAAVAAATHVVLDERVALKCLLPVLSDDPALKTRFLREAKAAIALRSEHVVRVHDVGELESGEPFIVMELLDGRDLDKVSRMGRLPVADVVAFVIQAAEALAEAHARGIVHRDVKPANLFVTKAASGERLVKVLDFGISRIADQAALTSVGHVVGSAHYMSPEQVGGAKDLDERTDVYSLGLTAYELLGGERPFKSGSVVEVSVQVVETEPKPLGELRPEIDPGLVAVVRKAHAKRREDRFRDMVELALALAPFASPEADAALAKLKRRATLAAANIVAGVAAAPARPPSSSTSSSSSSLAVGTSAAAPSPPLPPPRRAIEALPPPRIAEPASGPDSSPRPKRAIGTVTGVVLAALAGVVAAFGLVASGALGGPAPASTESSSPIPPATSPPAVSSPAASSPATASMPPSAAAAPDLVAPSASPGSAPLAPPPSISPVLAPRPPAAPPSAAPPPPAASPPRPSSAPSSPSPPSSPSSAAPPPPSSPPRPPSSPAPGTSAPSPPSSPPPPPPGFLPDGL